MENNQLNQLADILEYKISSRDSNNSGAAKYLENHNAYTMILELSK